ncbi:replication fork protection component Swi3-domain-containing protein [Lasiosphaeria hispida]|uniref:Chromosome segregation in meiosis protein n=1 Tax=Lasiosphaeria hispida TaxID=260671 RepID=A0AAJ0H7I8_9PEZI|nr:replication fork protection component Swi3-domain-containing protein [Lasiosphaeria hispida]
MPPKTTSKAAAAPNNPSDFVNDYLADWDDDPFRSPSPEPGSKKNDKNDKKRKEPDTLGIDEQIDITKKARAPRIKLDDARLLSEKGLPKLRKSAPRLKLKGKGHEFSDASRLLSFYQEWLDDLFPKATFLDALAMVEKAGHKTTLRNERVKWIDQGKPHSTANNDDEYPDREPSAPGLPTRIAPIFEQAAGSRAKTPTAMDDLFGDDDIYNSTPRAKTALSNPADDVPDEDDLDAMMAESELPATTQGRSFGSIFGGGIPKKPSQPSAEPDDDELDTLMAEAEAQPSRPKPSQPVTSIFGGGNTKRPIATPDEDEDEDELDALMAETDTMVAPPKSMAKPPASAVSDGAGTAKAKEPEKVATRSIEDDFDDMDDMDDLDALMAEADAGVTSTTAVSAVPPRSTQDYDEEAMAEMDEL